MKFIIFLIFIGLYFIPIPLVREIIINVFSVMWFVFTIIYVIYIYYNKDKEYEKSFKEEYCTVLPSNRPPETLGFLLTCSFKKEYFVASVLDLIRKKSIKIKKTKDYIMINNHKDDPYLTKSERFIKKWLFHDIGGGETVSFKALRNEIKYNGANFYSHYNDWINLVNLDCVRYDFFESKKDIFDQMLFYSSMSILVVLYNMFVVGNYTVGLIMLAMIIAFIMYVNNFYKRKRESSREYEEWMAFKRYINSNNKKISEINNDVLATYVVYCKVLGCSNTINNIINNKDIKLNDENEFLHLIKTGVIGELEKIIFNGINRARFLNIGS